MDTSLASPDKFKQFADVLFIYGPFAMVFLFILIAEWKIRPSLREATGQLRKVSVGTYIGAWTLVTVLAGFCIFAWFKINLHHEYVIKGTFVNIRGSETVTSDNTSLWLQRNYGGSDGNFNYAWRLISDKPLPAGQTIDFFLNRTAKTGFAQEALRVSLSVQSGFYHAQDVRIQFDRRSDSAYLLLDNKKSPLAAELLAAAPPSAIFPKVASAGKNIPRLLREALSMKVFAMDNPPQGIEVKNLASPDPIVRMATKKTLLTTGSNGVEKMLQTVADSTTPAPVRSATLTLLPESPSIVGATLPPPQQAAIVEQCASDNPTDRKNATKVLLRLSDANYDSLLESQIRREQQKSPRDPVRISRFALARMNLLYNNGIREKDLYRSGKSGDTTHLKTAISLFDKAYRLNTAAIAADKVIFAKALYGWALACHDRSWIERSADNQRKPQHVRAAQAKFREFLGFVKATPNPGDYPWPDHLKTAEAYLVTPELPKPKK